MKIESTSLSGAMMAGARWARALCTGQGRGEVVCAHGIEAGQWKGASHATGALIYAIVATRLRVWGKPPTN